MELPTSKLINRRPPTIGTPFIYVTYMPTVYRSSRLDLPRCGPMSNDLRVHVVLASICHLCDDSIERPRKQCDQIDCDLSTVGTPARSSLCGYLNFAEPLTFLPRFGIYVYFCSRFTLAYVDIRFVEPRDSETQDQPFEFHLFL